VSETEKRVAAGAVAVTASMIVVDLEDGRVLQVPIAWFPSIQAATLDQRRNVRLVGRGLGLHWPDLDEDVSIAGLLRGQPQNNAVADGGSPSTGVVVEAGRRENRISVFETIGCSIAVLHRLDVIWYDDDIRDIVTKVRSSLSVAQSKVKERIDHPIKEGTP